MLSKIQYIFRIQSDDFTMCWFYCITFIEYIISGKTFLDQTNLFPPNAKVINNYFKDKYSKSKCKLWV